MADKPKNSRHEKRVAAFKLLFARDFNKETDPAELYNAFLYEEVGENGELKLNKEYSSEYVKETYFGAVEKLDDIDADIESTSIKWKISRMSVPTRTVLRLAVYELLFTDTPPKVVINEAQHRHCPRIRRRNRSGICKRNPQQDSKKPRHNRGAAENSGRRTA